MIKTFCTVLCIKWIYYRGKLMEFGYLNNFFFYLYFLLLDDEKSYEISE